MRHEDCRAEWRIQDIESKVERKADGYEVATLRSQVDRLECALRDARTETDGLRDRMHLLEGRLEELTALVGEGREVADG